jgi:hypothetical protein
MCSITLSLNEDPTIAKPITETELPVRAKLRIDRVDAANIQFNTEQAEPKRPYERTEMEEATEAKDRTEAALPTRATDRKLKDEPR